jgi:hypothetical protein
MNLSRRATREKSLVSRFYLRSYVFKDVLEMVLNSGKVAE